MKSLAFGLTCSALALATATPLFAQTAPELPSITPGQTVTGEIVAPVTRSGCAEDPRVRSWALTAQPNSRLELTLNSETFDTVIEFGRMEGCTFQSLASNDDGDGPEDGLNSRLRVRLAQGGDYVVRARAFSEDGAGNFSLSVNALPPLPAAPAPRSLAPGREVRGTIGANDPVIAGAQSDDNITEGGRPYQLYSLTGQAGETYAISLDSNEFDPVLEAGGMTPLGFAAAMFNDDGPGEDDGLNSRLTINFSQAGTVVIRISPLGPTGGAYRLRATRR